jgi:hypothetical protein
MKGCRAGREGEKHCVCLYMCIGVCFILVLSLGYLYIHYDISWHSGLPLCFLLSALCSLLSLISQGSPVLSIVHHPSMGGMHPAI